MALDKETELVVEAKTAAALVAEYTLRIYYDEDVIKLNKAIIARWDLSTLDYIKKHAWRNIRKKTDNGNA